MQLVAWSAAPEPEQPGAAALIRGHQQVACGVPSQALEGVDRRPRPKDLLLGIAPLAQEGAIQRRIVKIVLAVHLVEARQLVEALTLVREGVPVQAVLA